MHTKLERITDTFYFNLLCALAASNLLVSAFRASSSALFFPGASLMAAFLLNGVAILCTLSHMSRVCSLPTKSHHFGAVF